MKSRFWIKVATLLLSMWLLTSCTSGQESLWLKSPDWSRGIFIGNTRSISPVSFVTASNENRYFLLVEANDDESEYSLILARLRSGSVDLDRFKLPIGGLQSVKQPEIVREEAGKLRLFWIDNEGLYTLVVSEDGAPVGGPVLLSGNDAVSSYDIAYADNGDVTLSEQRSIRIYYYP